MTTTVPAHNKLDLQLSSCTHESATYYRGNDVLAAVHDDRGKHNSSTIQTHVPEEERAFLPCQKHPSRSLTWYLTHRGVVCLVKRLPSTIHTAKFLAAFGPPDPVSALTKLRQTELKQAQLEETKLAAEKKSSEQALMLAASRRRRLAQRFATEQQRDRDRLKDEQQAERDELKRALDPSKRGRPAARFATKRCAAFEAEAKASDSAVICQKRKREWSAAHHLTAARRSPTADEIFEQFVSQECTQTPGETCTHQELYMHYISQMPSFEAGRPSERVFRLAMQKRFRRWHDTQGNYGYVGVVPRVKVLATAAETIAATTVASPVFVSSLAPPPPSTPTLLPSSPPITPANL